LRTEIRIFSSRNPSKIFFANTEFRILQTLTLFPDFPEIFDKGCLVHVFFFSAKKNFQKKIIVKINKTKTSLS